MPIASMTVTTAAAIAAAVLFISCGGGVGGGGVDHWRTFNSLSMKVRILQKGCIRLPSQLWSSSPHLSSKVCCRGCFVSMG